MYAKKFLKAVGETKKKDTNMVLNDATKGTMVGAAIGAGIGAFLAFGRKKNVLLGGFIGGALGGIVSRAFIIKK